MKPITIIFLLIVSVFFSMQSVSKSNKQSLDQIIAVVNDDVVTQSEYDVALRSAKQQLAEMNASDKLKGETVEQKVLDQLINKKLQLQLAKQAGIRVENAELEQTIQRIADQNHVSVKELYQHINQDGMSTADYRQTLQEQLLLQKIQQQEISAHLSVTPDEVKQFMRTKSWQTNGLKEYKIEDLIVPLSDTPSEQEITMAREQALAVITLLKKGKTIKAILDEAAFSPRIQQLDDLGWRKLADLPSAFIDPVSKLNVHGIAQPIQTSNGFHILIVDGVRSLETPAPSHEEIENILLQRKFTDAVQVWLSKLRAQAFILSHLSD